MLKKDFIDIQDRETGDVMTLLSSEYETETFYKDNGKKDTERIDDIMYHSCFYLMNLQNHFGYWQFALETDTTITSEYILLSHFLGIVDKEREKKLCNYILSKQSPEGGWNIYEGGPFDISASVKAYFALKCAGYSPDIPPMKKALLLIRHHGGAAEVNVFTQIYLALLGQLPWHLVPAMPVEIMLLPRWFFFHMDKVSYWARTIIAPLTIILTRKPVKKIPSHKGIKELFLIPPDKSKRLHHLSRGLKLKNLFVIVDNIVKGIDSYIPVWLRQRAHSQALSWVIERLNHTGGLGGIFPAMANSLIMLNILGYDRTSIEWTEAKKAVDDLVIERDNDAFCQPCIGPVWDTCLSLIAVIESGISPKNLCVQNAIRWLMSKQITTLKGDWNKKAPHVVPGGWCFQLNNPYYPDVDDTSMVLMALLRAGAHHEPRWYDAIKRAVRWIVGMQSKDGGWAAFDIDNNCHYLNEIPFADHNALIDPSTPDVTARCIEALAMCGYGTDYPPLKRAIELLLSQQEKNGSWYGRWGVNYIYGTWSVLSAFGALGFDSSFAPCASATSWLQSVQNSDGGWGENCASYANSALAGKGESIPSITSWALLGLMAVGETDCYAVRRGIDFLLSRFNNEGTWYETLFSGTGFPRFFYLRYTGYSHIFPLWTLGVYRTVKLGKETCQKRMTLSTPLIFF
jgi:squalene-hopene/tetraprenyl-beta-curcumene cyclase